MGFIAKLKQMFSSNIVYSSDGETRLGVLYKNKATKLKINSYIVIEDRSTCIVVYKNNIMDFLYGKGKFRITKDDLPHLFDRAITEKNKDCKYIKADLYFVNATELKKFVFSSSKPFILKTRDYGK